MPNEVACRLDIPRLYNMEHPSVFVLTTAAKLKCGCELGTGLYHVTTWATCAVKLLFLVLTHSVATCQLNTVSKQTVPIKALSHWLGYICAVYVVALPLIHYGEGWSLICGKLVI